MTKYFVKNGDVYTRNFKIGDSFTFPNGEEDIIDHFEPILPLGIMVGKKPDNYIHLADERLCKKIGVLGEGWIGIYDGHQFDSEELLDLITIKL